MSRSRKKTKPPGSEYWSRRPVSNAHGALPGPVTKKLTHRKERRIAERELHRED